MEVFKDDRLMEQPSSIAELDNVASACIGTGDRRSELRVWEDERVPRDDDDDTDEPVVDGVAIAVPVGRERGVTEAITALEDGDEDLDPETVSGDFLLTPFNDALNVVLSCL